MRKHPQWRTDMEGPYILRSSPTENPAYPLAGGQRQYDHLAPAILELLVLKMPLLDPAQAKGGKQGLYFNSLEVHCGRSGHRISLGLEDDRWLTRQASPFITLGMITRMPRETFSALTLAAPGLYQPNQDYPVYIPLTALYGDSKRVPFTDNITTLKACLQAMMEAQQQQLPRARFLQGPGPGKGQHP